eukprot:534603_1
MTSLIVNLWNADICAFLVQVLSNCSAINSTKNYLLFPKLMKAKQIDVNSIQMIYNQIWNNIAIQLDLFETSLPFKQLSSDGIMDLYDYILWNKDQHKEVDEKFAMFYNAYRTHVEPRKQKEICDKIIQSNSHLNQHNSNETMHSTTSSVIPSNKRHLDVNAIDKAIEVKKQQIAEAKKKYDKAKQTYVSIGNWLSKSADSHRQQMVQQFYTSYAHSPQYVKYTPQQIMQFAKNAARQRWQQDYNKLQTQYSNAYAQVNEIQNNTIKPLTQQLAQLQVTMEEAIKNAHGGPLAKFAEYL